MDSLARTVPQIRSLHKLDGRLFAGQLPAIGALDAEHQPFAAHFRHKARVFEAVQPLDK